MVVIAVWSVFSSSDLLPVAAGSLALTLAVDAAVYADSFDLLFDPVEAVDVAGHRWIFNQLEGFISWRGMLICVLYGS